MGRAMKHIPFDSTQVYIGGRWRAGDDGRTLPLADPSDGAELTRIARGSAPDIDAAVKAARAAFEGAWGALSAAERGRLLLKMSARVLEQADELARLEALDVGKRLKQGDTILFEGGLSAEITHKSEAEVYLRFNMGGADLDAAIEDANLRCFRRRSRNLACVQIQR